MQMGGEMTLVKEMIFKQQRHVLKHYTYCSIRLYIIEKNTVKNVSHPNYSLLYRLKY